MRHESLRRRSETPAWFLLLICGLIITGCATSPLRQTSVRVSMEIPRENGSDTQSLHLDMPAGSTVEEALTKARITLGVLDRVEPPAYTVVRAGMQIRVIRAEEKFEVKETTLPFDRQTVRNQNLPVGEIRLVQAGENGLQEVTARFVYENGKLLSQNQVKSTVIKQPVSEILMVGSQQPFLPIAIPGKLAYLTGGNAWVMEKDSGERRALVTSGRLDGRIFSLSSDGAWLLFTQRNEDEKGINFLSAISTDGKMEKPIDLGVKNVVHYAGWVPGAGLRIAYSTVEPRSAAPGWQANNDLFSLDFSANGWISTPTGILPAGAGGIYGWWGTDFAWSPDGSKLVYARPDEIGLVNMQEASQTPLLKVTPYQTQGDWAWIPGLSWSPDGNMLYTVVHNGQGEMETAENSPVFDLAGLTMQGTPVKFLSQAGMFAYPSPSPAKGASSSSPDYRLAFLQAVFPEQSQSSRYRLAVVDRDGSNKRELFPPEGLPGLEPQRVMWSPGRIRVLNRIETETPDPAQGDGSQVIAVVYQGDVWFADAETGTAYQITGEGVVNRLDWK